MTSDKKPEKAKSSLAVQDDEEHFVYKSLIEQLKDPSPLRRESACWMLGELRYKAADKAISRLLTQDKDPLVRYGATHALERIGDSWAVQAIIRGLKDSDVLVRRACIDCLGRMQDKQAVYPLEALIKGEPEEDLKIMAREALLNINGKKLKNTSSAERKIYKYLRQIELNPDSANAHYNLAVAYFHAKRLNESKAHCETARKLGANVGWLVEKLDGSFADSGKDTPERQDRQANNGVPVEGVQTSGEARGDVDDFSSSACDRFEANESDEETSIEKSTVVETT